MNNDKTAGFPVRRPTGSNEDFSEFQHYRGFKLHCQRSSESQRFHPNDDAGMSCVVPLTLYCSEFAIDNCQKLSRSHHEVVAKRPARHYLAVVVRISDTDVPRS